jgi:hypothetical protein
MDQIRVKICEHWSDGSLEQDGTKIHKDVPSVSYSS